MSNDAQIGLRLPALQAERLRALARAENCSCNDLLRNLIDKEINNRSVNVFEFPWQEVSSLFNNRNDIFSRFTEAESIFSNLRKQFNLIRSVSEVFDNVPLKIEKEDEQDRCNFKPCGTGINRSARYHFSGGGRAGEVFLMEGDGPQSNAIVAIGQFYDRNIIEFIAKKWISTGKIAYADKMKIMNGRVAESTDEKISYVAQDLLKYYWRTSPDIAMELDRIEYGLYKGEDVEPLIEQFKGIFYEQCKKDDVENFSDSKITIEFPRSGKKIEFDLEMNS